MWFKICFSVVFISVLKLIPAECGKFICHSNPRRQLFHNHNGLEFDASKCHLLQLNLSFENNTSLLSVNASHNEIEILTNTTFLDMQQLLKIDVSHNKIFSIHPETFNESPGLVEIYLNNNSIFTLAESVFENLENLTILHLEYNKIMILEEKLFATNQKLRTVLLSHNQIVAIGPSVFKSLNGLETLDLTENVCIDQKFMKYEKHFLVKINEFLDEKPTVVKYTNCLKSYPIYLTLTKQFSRLDSVGTSELFDNICPRNSSRRHHLIETLFSGDHLYIIPTMFFVISFVINIILCVCFFYMFRDDHSAEKPVSPYGKIDPNFDPGRRVSIRRLPESSSSDSGDEKTDEKSETENLNQKNLSRRMQRRVSFDDRIIRRNYNKDLSKDVYITLPTTPE